MGNLNLYFSEEHCQSAMDFQPGKQSLRGCDNFPQVFDVFEEMGINLCTKQNSGQWVFEKGQPPNASRHKPFCL